MKVVNNKDINKVLQNREVQERVRQRMLEARSRASVTISVASNLSGFTESQLREWDKRGFLQTDRTTPATEGKGHRQYTPQDLDKLMLMRELINRGYSLSDILPNIDFLWKQVAGNQVAEQALSEMANARESRLASEVERLPIDIRAERADEEYFWRYFVAQVLRLSLLLITEDTPGTIAGLILPVEGPDSRQRITSPFDVPRAGPSLVGWLDENQLIFASFDPAPSFEVPSDFRVETLPGWDETAYPSPIVITQRKARPLTVTKEQVASIQRMIELVYRHIADWQPGFGYRAHDLLDHATNYWLHSTINDTLISRLMDRIVELGGQEDSHSRWTFCDMFLPKDPTLPKQQRTLTVRAYSKESPARTTWMELTQDRPGLTYRAYQSGQIICRPHFFMKDALLAYQETEPSTRSGIAIPLGSADGMIAGAIYIASDEVDAFTLADQRALRLLMRMVEELLAAYQGRVFVSEDLSEAIAKPRVVDSFFADFLSEEDFINEFEALLTNMLEQEDPKELEGKEVSFIVIDIDNQSTLAVKYGDRATRNLCREVGLKLLDHPSLTSDPKNRKVYHIAADRYYLKLVGMSLDDARNLAEQLRMLLKNDYRVDIRRAGNPLTTQEMLVLQNVTVRLGVLNWSYLKLKKLLERSEKTENAVAQVRAIIFGNFEQALKLGQAEGGDCVISWDTGVWGYIRWSPSKST